MLLSKFSVYYIKKLQFVHFYNEFIMLGHNEEDKIALSTQLYVFCLPLFCVIFLV